MYDEDIFFIGLMVGVLIMVIFLFILILRFNLTLSSKEIAKQWCNYYNSDVIKYDFSNLKLTELICKSRIDGNIFEVIKKSKCG